MKLSEKLKKQISSHPKTSLLKEDHNEGNESGLMVIPRDQISANELSDLFDEDRIYYEWDVREGYFFLPEEEDMYDELELQIQNILDNNNINARIEGIFNEVSKFKVGDKSRSGDITTQVTDVDDETQSVTWDVKNEITDETIRKDLSSLITKFEKVHMKNFHDKPKLAGLVKELRSIRNRFTRTMK